jgi:hypothetical protein
LHALTTGSFHNEQHNQHGSVHARHPGRAVMRNIRQNLCFTFRCNSLAPVTGNSLRLRRKLT